ncbi:NAD-dependent succinate-semialdehyde dehydrogenase [Maribacter sp. PR1]|uniref:NAD-dependent succinate-semialdehyde dehydrogenase n=1 Tax=Maribacter cobaltidurans TaxID=1178778 RepID=A0ABU7IU51_9FLAO|nr:MULTISPECIES: NAD-dependent succinate-semialdehyde dehydrogenase [Maribacter]MDC6389022.1 NAD-dependent succinate-semialdehyde dehydrogenase [Maribacter sp. PR1]MEE1976410.1 NAD-dependent succinate-semialdehyde dehydrogenase [Maribacter cobaltidurans]
MSSIWSKNPYTGEKLKEYTKDTDSTITEKLKITQSVQKDWANLPITERCNLLDCVSELLLERKEEYANLITSEMGKPISQSIAEIEKCAWACDFYGYNAEDLLADEIIETDAEESFISYDPLGCILAVMPWNYPFWQVIRFAAPTLTAGNTGILKHAQNVPGCAKALEQLFLDAGYPKGCFQSILAGHEEIENLIAHKTIKAVTLTGSEKAGRGIAETAGKNLKKTVLELGGNNPCIVFEDADLDEYLETMLQARMQNTGQSCIAAKRFIVCSEIYEDFISKFIAATKNLKVGNPKDSDTYIGVLAREDLAETLKSQVDKSLEKGAKLVLGNSKDGAYFEPTILTDVVPGMPAFDEETFGPVAAIIKAHDRTHAISLANQSSYGLGAMLFTEDMEAALELIPQISDGAFFVNDMVKSDPRLPFGGTKASGYGRELSREGILEFVNKKTVYLKN